MKKGVYFLRPIFDNEEMFFAKNFFVSFCAQISSSIYFFLIFGRFSTTNCYRRSVMSQSFNSGVQNVCICKLKCSMCSSQAVITFAVFRPLSQSFWRLKSFLLTDTYQPVVFVLFDALFHRLSQLASWFVENLKF